MAQIHFRDERSLAASRSSPETHSRSLLAAACAALALARSTPSKPAAILAMLAAWLLLYFFCHGIAHWAVGRLLGIRFAFYTVGGTGNPGGYPLRMRLALG